MGKRPGAKSGGKVPVGRRALLQRVNRKLAERREQLKPARGGRAQAELGDYYLLRRGRGGAEPSTNIVETHVDLGDYARTLGVLQSYEMLVDEAGS